MAPHANVSGVSDRLVDENFIAPAGVPPQVAINEGMPDVGNTSPDEDTERENKRNREIEQVPAEREGDESTRKAATEKQDDESKSNASTGKLGTSAASAKKNATRATA